MSTDKAVECASVNAAQALANWSKARKGEQAGKAAGFPRFKSGHKTTPAFRLRAKYQEGAAPSVRSTGPKTVKFPKLGELRVRESTRQLRRMLGSGRFHVYAAAFRFERGRWVVSVTGVAAELHHQRRTPKHRHQSRVGVDLGVKTLHRSEEGSPPPAPGEGRVAHLRRNLLHTITSELARGCTSVTVENLNAAGMLQNRKLARVVSDAAFGEFRRQLEYKTAWYGTELVVADRWFPSSKTCSGCGEIKADLTLSDRVYICDACDLVIDRDVNAAINLARYTDTNIKPSPPLPAAA